MKNNNFFFENKYFVKNVYENLSEGFCICRVDYDSEGNIQALVPIYANASLEKQIGVKSEVFLKSNILANKVNPNYERLLSVAKVAISKEPYSDYYNSSQLGKTIKFSAHPADDNYIYALVTDLSESLEVKRSLKESETLINSILNSIDQVIFSVTMDGKLIFISNHTEEIYKLPPSAFYENTNLWFEIIYKDDKELVLNEIDLAHKKGFFETDYRILRADGEIRWVHNQSKIIYENGIPIRIDGQIYDVTDSKIQELELQKKNRLITGFYLANPLLMGVVEVEKDFKKVKHISGNKSFKDFMDKSESDYPFYIELTDDDLENPSVKIWLAKYKEAYEENRSVYFEYDFDYEGQTYYHYVVLSYLSLSEDDNPQYSFIINDITPRKIAEIQINNYAAEMEKKSIELQNEIEKNINIQKELIEAKDIADKANKAKSEFLANISHEIRTPMNAIMGFAKLIRENESDTKLMHYADGILTGGKSLMNVINDILDLSKIESGTLSIHNDVVDIFKMTNEIYRLFSLKSEEKNIKLLNFITSSTPRFIYIDEFRIRQILINLVSNAIKFTETGYVLILVDSKPMGKKSNISFHVIDTGIGISEDQSKIIFEAFIQSDSQSNKKFGGTGLGLTISRKLAGLMNGDIKLESNINEGSKFSAVFDNISIVDSAENPQTFFDELYSMSFKNTGIIANVSDKIKLNLKKIASGSGDFIVFFDNTDQINDLKILPQLIIIEKGNIEDLIIMLESITLNNVPLMIISEDIESILDLIPKYNIRAWISPNARFEQLAYELTKFIRFEIQTNMEEDTVLKLLDLEMDKILFEEVCEIVRERFSDFRLIFEGDISLDKAKEFAGLIINVGDELNENAFRQIGNYIINKINSYDFNNLSIIIKHIFKLY
ncbi:MAG: PAS domain-containing protein [Candidatus Kapabacteria bacterium]|nr:PAS domain-containing protein [Ignavibacteriota bacterium]MCW5884194.1 PAS domain-containing protein [Candidatus Kapabacteria bacterium]